MRKRLRKKKHLGEFQQLGFELSFRYRPADAETDNVLLDAFLREAIEANGLQFGGGGGPGAWAGFAASDARYGGATDADRETVRAWLASRSEITEFAVGPLRDAWHGW